jgi:hypothetical protein
MAISINQGYVRSFNLSETIDEIKAINNLVGGSISDDLSIFASNTKNISKVVYKPGIANHEIISNKIFKFDLLACYGNGDPIKIKAGRSISNIVYNTVNDTLTVTFNEPHGLTVTDIATKVTIRLRDTFFDGPGTIRFNEKDYAIESIVGTNTLLLSGIEYDGQETGLFTATNRYPYAICSLFPLPQPLSYTEDYFVVLSNAVDRFQIATSYVQGQLVNPITITSSVNIPLIFERLNEVTQESLRNLALPEFQDDDFDYNNDVLRRSFGENFDLLESYLDAANYFRFKKYTRSQDNYFDANPIKIGGNIRTIDPDGFNSSTSKLFDTHSPGVFIVDPSSSIENIIRLRAFSDNTQPWELDQISGTLEYAVIAGRLPANQEMSIGNMVLKGNPISMDGVQNIIVESISGLTPPQRFTHKLPVIINGEEYNFLLTDSTT